MLSSGFVCFLYGFENFTIVFFCCLYFCSNNLQSCISMSNLLFNHFNPVIFNFCFYLLKRKQSDKLNSNNNNNNNNNNNSTNNNNGVRRNQQNITKSTFIFDNNNNSNNKTTSRPKTSGRVTSETDERKLTHRSETQTWTWNETRTWKEMHSTQPHGVNFSLLEKVNLRYKNVLNK